MDDNKIQEVINNNEDAMDEVTDTAQRLFSGEYTQNHALFGMQVVIMNLKLMTTIDYSEYLKNYFSITHKVTIK